MPQTHYATYDGKVFIPEGNVDLLPNQRYIIRVETQVKSEPSKKPKLLQKLAMRATDMGVTDLAEQHDHYLYGTEKI